MPALRKRRVDLLLGDVVKRHVIARQRNDMGDTAAHLACAYDADLANGNNLSVALRGVIGENRRALNYVVHNHSSSRYSIACLFELGVELGQDREQIADEAVIRDLENRCVGILIDGDDHL